MPCGEFRDNHCAGISAPLPRFCTVCSPGAIANSPGVPRPVLRFARLVPRHLLLIAGKGHERGQIVGTTVHPFEDAKTVCMAIAEAGS